VLPRGLSREQAAEYVGISSTKFGELVEDGRMPRPKQIDGRRVWDLRALDEAFNRLDGGAAEDDPWGSVAL
jgi:excisionase family DNA binding protein